VKSISIKNLLIDSLLAPIVESTCLITVLCNWLGRAWCLISTSATKLNFETRKIYVEHSVVQLQAGGPHVTRHGVFSGPRKHSGKIFKSEIVEKRMRLHLSQRKACDR